MSIDIDGVLSLIRRANGRRTLYLVKTPFSDVRATMDVPCGQSRSVRLGRWPVDSMPTRDELESDILRARQMLDGAGRKRASA